MKRFAVISLSVASTFLVFSAGAFALSPSAQLEAGNARLTRELDTAHAMKGQMVTAKLTETIETPEGLKLPNGTELMGFVDQVQASHDKSPARLSLTFDKAQLKDGKDVAIKATLVAVAPSGAPDNLETKVAGNDSFDQEPGLLSGVSLHSKVQSNSSGTLISRDKNIRLVDGTQMQIAIAPASAMWNTRTGS